MHKANINRNKFESKINFGSVVLCFILWSLKDYTYSLNQAPYNNMHLHLVAFKMAHPFLVFIVF